MTQSSGSEKFLQFSIESEHFHEIKQSIDQIKKDIFQLANRNQDEGFGLLEQKITFLETNVKDLHQK